MKKIKIIAHGANSLEEIEKALSQGADFTEVDVSKQVFTSRFVAQHQGVLGKFGIGENLEKILAKIPQDKVIFDIKHPQFTPSFSEKFDELFKKFNFGKANIVSDNWKVLVKLAARSDYRIYFLVKNERDVVKLATTKNNLQNKNFGAIIAPKFLDKVDSAKLHENSLKILTGPINDVELCQRALAIGVSGIITDQVKLLAKFLFSNGERDVST